MEKKRIAHLITEGKYRGYYSDPNGVIICPGCQKPATDYDFENGLYDTCRTCRGVKSRRPKNKPDGQYMVDNGKVDREPVCYVYERPDLQDVQRVTAHSRMFR